MNCVVQETGAGTLSRLTSPLHPSAATQRFQMDARGHVLAAAGDRRCWADQSESATTMTTQAVIFGHGGGLLTWDGRL